MMSAILNDPEIKTALSIQHLGDMMSGRIAEHLISKGKKWRDMSVIERQACVRYLVKHAETEKDLRNHLSRLGLNEGDIDCLIWDVPEPTDEVADKEALVLCKLLGGLVSGNGAYVTLFVDGELY
jgi:hypothetical protein